MTVIAGIGFTAPWILWALLALPVLWVILRAIPPAPVRRLFPGVALLLRLSDDEAQTDKTPWWLLLLRTVAIAAAIVGFAGPVINPETGASSNRPLLVLLDGTWADAPDWQQRLERVGVALDEAQRSGRPVAVATLARPPAGTLPFRPASDWRSLLPSLHPSPWQPRAADIRRWIEGWGGGKFDTLWLSDGVDWPARAPLAEAVQRHGTLRVVQNDGPVLGLRPAEFAEDGVRLKALRADAGAALSREVIASGPDPTGVERQLARARIAFDAGAKEAEVTLSLQPELRNRVTSFELVGVRSAAAVSLADDALKRRKVGLVAAETSREGLELLSPLHYLRRALETTADLIEGGLVDIVQSSPDVIVLADVARLTEAEAAALTAWVEGGGLLLRFAGPRLAASDVARNGDDPLMPVRLRVGGRSVGGAMSWGEPKALRAFDRSSPFFGLSIPPDVRVNAQVMAQPSAELADRVIASLTDGTPLVTRKTLGEGQVVLFHVTANAQWSSLPLSGLFVQMLERLAVSTPPERPTSAELEGTTWTPSAVLDAYGEVQKVDDLPGVPGKRLATERPGPDLPPGLYANGERQVAINVISADSALAPAKWPSGVEISGLARARETLLKGWLLGLALLALMLDALASLWLTGRLPAGGKAVTAAGLAVLLAAALPAPHARAQDADARAIEATTGVVLAHVLTGDARVDRIAEAGLRGLSDVLFLRTSVEPEAPIGVDVERDELSFYPLLYWPITDSQPIPSAEAYAKLNDYLRTGGVILFDTRDANLAGFGSGSRPAGDRLARLAAALDVPPLEPVPEDHVLTRTFYLLQDFPGRFTNGDVWVEAAPPDAARAEGMPFRNLNDNVSPVIIGSNDWAGAWAVDRAGAPMLPVGRGFAGERQREMAYRFGVNVVMYVLTGNYKSDQVHVPALLERLGQ